jgi:nucleotide-binding universal stress UspA family protein
MKTREMKKVLIALDYDPTAKKIAETGYAIARAMGAEVTLLHVITDPVFYYSSDYSTIMGFSGYMDMSPYQLDNVNGLKNASLHFLETTKQHLGNETIQTLVLEGDFADVILATAKTMHADMIVLGSHSHRWLEDVLIGSVTEKLLHHSTIPLFIIPTKKHK